MLKPWIRDVISHGATAIAGTFVVNMISHSATNGFILFNGLFAGLMGSIIGWTRRNGHSA